MIRDPPTILRLSLRPRTTERKLATYVVQCHHDVQDMTMTNCSLAYAIAGRIESDFSHVFFRKFGGIRWTVLVADGLQQ